MVAVLHGVVEALQSAGGAYGGARGVLAALPADRKVLFKAVVHAWEAGAKY